MTLKHQKADHETEDWIGIHGQPFCSWDGISKKENFCAHNEPTFPTWHRPYQLLLEVCRLSAA